MSIADPTAVESKHFHLEAVADGVYVAIASVDGGAVCNAGLIDLGDQVVIFDTFLTPQAALDLHAAAERLPTPHNHHHQQPLAQRPCEWQYGLSAGYTHSGNGQNARIAGTYGQEELVEDLRRLSAALPELEAKIAQEQDQSRRKSLTPNWHPTENTRRPCPRLKSGCPPRPLKIGWGCAAHAAARSPLAAGTAPAMRCSGCRKMGWRFWATCFLCNCNPGCPVATPKPG